MGASTPSPTTAQRLKAFPTADLALEHPVTVRWNDFQVPYIEAQSDRDLAFALGLVNGHLRSGQIHFLHRLATGRLAEMLGPWAVELDHFLRILDLGAAASAIEAQLPDETRQWCQAFVDGLNCYWSRLSQRPPELELLGVHPEPWTVRDLAVMGRMMGADFYWLTFLNLLKERDKPDFATLWRRMRQAGEPSPQLAIPGRQAKAFGEWLVNHQRAGSNSIAVAPALSASQGAWIASDPHLGPGLPNFFLLVGLRSPSYALVGLMIPGLPAVVVGRNPDIAWGGTNMRAASSDLFDVSGLPREAIREETITIRTRFGRNRHRTVRRTPFGPILSDAKLCPGKAPAIALKWVGHEVSDELTAILQASKARTPEAFRRAFKSYGLIPVNLVFADRGGNIGELMAVKQPLRSGFPEGDMVLDATDPSTHWQGFAGPLDLPWTLNPPEGFIVSANNRPAESNIPIGYLFGLDSRKRRLESEVRARGSLDFDDLVALQTDTSAPDAGALASALAAEILKVTAKPRALALAGELQGWDGDYGFHSRGALLFELLLYHLCRGVFQTRDRAALQDPVCQWSFIVAFLLPDLAALTQRRRERLLRRSVAKVWRDARRYPTWGDMHRLRLAHPLGLLPGVGRWFTFEDLPVGGSRQTPMKSAHGLVRRRHKVGLSSVARHISHLGDPDANWFAILGGQDGWLNAANFRDQVALWRQRRYIRMPLRPETVASEFPRVLTLTPKATAPASPPESAPEG